MALRVSGDGRIVMGIGDGRWSLDNQDMGRGGSPAWLTDTHVVRVAGDGIYRYGIHTREDVQVCDHGANDLMAGGGVWAANRPRIDLVDSLGRAYPSTSALMDVGPDGAVCYMVDSHANSWDASYVVREVDGHEWPLVGGSFAREIQLLGNRRAIWRDDSYHLHTSGIIPPVVIQGERLGTPRAFQLGQEWWLLYWRHESGPLVLRPFGDVRGYYATAPGELAFGYAVDVVDAHTVNVVWSIGQGEQPGELDEKAIDVNSTRMDLALPIDIPKIGRPCWLAWFEFNLPSVRPPGHAWVDVRRDEEPFVKSFAGDILGYYTAAEKEGTLEALEVAVKAARAKHPGVPVVAYWPRGFHEIGIPDTDILGMECYCSKTESIAAFEARVRRTLNHLPASLKVALVAQAYSSNDSQTTDLSGLVPVYARLARDFANVWAILAFSDFGRSTGLADHPDIRPLWQRLADGIAGTPAIEPPMNTPSVKVNAWTLDELKDGREFSFEDEANGGPKVRVWIEGGSMRAEMSNSVGKGQTGQRRPVKPCPPIKPIDPPIHPIDPPKTETFRMRRKDRADGYISVGPDGYLRQGASGAACAVKDGGLVVNGKFVACEMDNRCKADRPNIGSDWERWTLEGHADGSVSIKSKRNGKYLSLHDDGSIGADQPHALGWETFVKEAASAAVARPLQGPLRIQNKVYADDTGYRRVLFYSWFPAIRILRDDPAAFYRQLDAIAAAGYQGVRLFVAVGGYQDYWGGKEVVPVDFTNDRGTRIDAWPDFDDLWRACLKAFADRKLRMHVTTGDTQFIFAGNPGLEIFTHQRLAGIARAQGGLSVIAVWEAHNELWQNSLYGDSQQQARQDDDILRVVRAELPDVLTMRGSLNSEEPADLMRSCMSGEVCAIHQTRQPPESALKRTFGLEHWEGTPKFFPKPFWFGEPGGIQGDVAGSDDVYAPLPSRDWLVGLYGMMSCTGYAVNYFDGTSVRNRAEIGSVWGFKEIPQLMAHIPEDVGSWGGSVAPGGAIWYWHRDKQFATATCRGWNPAPPRPVATVKLITSDGVKEGGAELIEEARSRDAAVLVGTFA